MQENHTMDPFHSLQLGNGLNLPTAKKLGESHGNDNKNRTEMEAIIDMLKRGEKEIELKDEYKNVILILGNTGSGKSTFTQWIAGDNSKLIAKEVNEGTGEFIIEDGDRIGNSTIKSKTVFPELVVDNNTNVAFYDCPGFSDTRSTSNDIATTYFIKKVLDHSESVKMIFVISYPSVRKGVDRQDFMQLLRHATDLLIDVDKFRNSIAIVATKVDNQYVKQGTGFTLVGDTKIIKSIADFLQEVKQSLEDEAMKRQTFNKKAIQFIDALLDKDDEHYTKIGLFRRPNEPGPLSNIALLQEGKAHIKKTLLQELNFTQKADSDFGFTVSEKSKNDINDLVEDINQSIWTGVNNVAGVIQTFYISLAEAARKKMESFLVSTSVIDANKSEAQILSTKLRNGYNETINLVEEISNLSNPKELSGKLGNIITSLGIHAFEDVLSNIADQGKYFNFLQVISDKTLSTRPWADVFQGTLVIICESRKNVQDDANKAAEKIVSRIQSEFNATAKTMQDHYDEEIKLLEIQKLPEKLSKDHSTMFDTVKEMKKLTTTTEMLKNIRNIVNSLDISIPKESILNIAYQGKYFEYVQILSDKKLRTGSSTWFHPFEDVVQYIYESEKWYTWLNDLYGKFSEYKVQKDRYKYNVADINDWGKSGKPQGIVITANNFQNFLSKASQFKITEHDAVKHVTVTDLKLDELNNILSTLLKYRIDIRCSEPHIFVKGNYISLKETVHNIKNKVDVDGSCGNFLSVLKSKRFTFLNVFAANTIFVDQDLSLLRPGLSIAFVAPRWEVIGTRKFDFSGADGEPHKEPKAKNGIHPGSRGIDGAPGLPGKPGGNFFGIGGAFAHGTNLTVTVDGGRGGPGQSGGDGFKGSNGRSATIPSIKSTPCQDGLTQIEGLRCEKIDFIQTSMRCGGFGAQVVCDPGVLYCKYKIFGESGKRGGDGGNGGFGGKGGKPGNVMLFELNDKSEILATRNEGRDGDIGRAGIGGGSGDDGDDVIVMFDRDRRSSEWLLVNRIRKNGGSPGKNGTDGVNDYNMQQPEEANVIDKELAEIVNEYKTYLRENLSDRCQSALLKQFLQQLDSNTSVKRVYNTLGLVNELGGLEKQLHTFNKDIDFIHFYEVLLNRISEYSQNPKELEKTREYRKVLSYLYTATLGRIYSLRENTESNLIIDISGYLELVQKDIAKLKDLQSANNKVNIIKRYNENYKRSFENKIKEAEVFIQKQITPEINNIISQIDDEIDLLIGEIIQLQKQAEKEREALLQKKQELERSLALRGLFSVFKIAGQVISFLGPVGAAVGAIVEATTSVTESLVLDKQHGTLPPSVASNVRFARDQIKIINSNKIDSLNKLLNELLQESSKLPEKLGDITIKVKDIKIRLNKVHREKLDFRGINMLENELKQELKAKEEDLNNQKTVTDQKSANALKVIEKFNQVIQLGSVVLDITSKFKNDEAKMDAINNAIKNVEKKLQNLKQYEDRIYDTVAPMLQVMENNLYEVAAKLENKSQAALDVSKWQVQTTLRDMKLEMQKVTEGLEVKDDLARCIEKLEETMNTLINVYGRIQGYEEQQNLANYIADISSTTAFSIDISDTELKNAVNHLEITIRSNLVLQLYKNAMNAFQQWVFPFAHRYLDTCARPSFIEVDNTIEHVVSKAIEQIEGIKLKMDLYKTSVRSKDEYKRSGEFNSRFVSAEPFYVWQNDQNKSPLKKLLSGQEVVLKADVQHSPADKDAVKFSFIELIFKTGNATVQSQLNNTLKGFSVTMTHMGNSYYRYGENIYLITSDSQSIWYTFEKNDAGEPVRKNEPYIMITKGDLMLSPYAAWKIKLTNSTSRTSFQDLEVYRDDINLELSGYGSYVVRYIHEPSDGKIMIETRNALDLDIESNIHNCKHSTASNLNDVLSADDISEAGNYATNTAAASLASPINYVCNMLKMYVMTNIVTSVNRLFTNKAFKIRSGNDNCCDPTKNSMKSHLKATSDIKSKPKTREEEPDATDGSIEKEDSIREDGNEDCNLSDISSCRFQKYSGSYKLALPYDQQVHQNVRIPQIFEINSSLLLADLITRSISGMKYKSTIHDSLLSPQEVISRKIKNGTVQNESDIEQNLYSVISEMDNFAGTFWFNKVKYYAKSTLQFLGFVEKDDVEYYIEDIRKLFIHKNQFVGESY